MRDIVIFGAGEIAEVASYYFMREESFRVAAFVVDEDFMEGRTSFCGHPLVSSVEIVKEFPPSRYHGFVAMGYSQMNKIRAEKYRWMKDNSYELVSYVSRRCSNFALAIGSNCLILEDNTIQPFVTIGDNVMLWSGNHIGHHSYIGNNSFVSSHVVISGGVKIGNSCFIGVNATLRDHITIGDETLIGAGALVNHSTEPRSILRGVPAELMSVTSNKIRRI